jgi:signal transduction histidine kinase
MAVYLLLAEKAGSLTSKQTELLIAARDDCERLHSILGNLLDISRIESGKLPMSLRADVSPEVAEVWADPNRIGHALGNLLSNALKYTSPGGCATISAREEGEMVRFLVSDTGKGIPQQYLNCVFDQFFRVPCQEDATGEGLGLAIVKEIVEAHGGSVDVQSREGEGSVFAFSLRRADHVYPEQRA